MLHRIREAMKRDPLAGLLRGTIVADETYLGGKNKNRHADKRYETGRGTAHKQPVMALVDFETREVRSKAIPTVDSKSLRENLQAEVEIDASQLWTDEAGGYILVGREFNSHHTVNHSEGIYKRRGVTTNYAEGYFSQLKRSLDGTHHHVSTTHLDRYLANFDFMYTNCKDTDTDRMRKLVANTTGRRLTYKPLTEGSSSATICVEG